MDFSQFSILALIGLFFLGMLLICVSGDRLVDASVAISEKIGIPQIVVGATIVSIGTTLPEILVSSISAFTGEADMAAGNAFGSIICNTALIAGLSQTIRPASRVNAKSVGWRCAFFFAAITLVEIVGLVTGGSLGHLLGIVLLIAFGCYAWVTIRRASVEGDEEETPQEDAVDVSRIRLSKQFLILLVCAVFLFLGAFLLKESGVNLAARLGVPSSVIAVTLVALSTSLPELATSVLSLIKGYENVGLGNIIGANLLNLLLVLGIPGAISGIRVQDKLFFRIDAPLAILVMAILIVPILVRKKSSRVQGVTLLVIYVAYCVLSFFLK